MHKVGIALGANLGDRLQQIQSARDAIQVHSSQQHCLQAPIYHSAPQDCPNGSPDFYNTVIEIIYHGTPEQLLSITQNIELELGREAEHGFNTPRLIDLDLLYFGKIEICTELLTIPHPEITQRRFVLQPLADIQPDLILPHQQKNVSSLLSQLDEDDSPLKVAHYNW